MRLFVLTALAMLAFAGNSILNRLALADGLIAPGSFALIRLISGALMLALLVQLRPRLRGQASGRVNEEATQSAQPSASPSATKGATQGGRGDWLRQGSLVGALSLAVYAVGFSFAYLGMDAGLGALLLFGVVQVTMFGAALVRQREVIGRLRWLGTGMALLGLAILLLPGASAPEPLFAVLMIAAAVAWGFYTLAGRVAQDPLAATAANFVLASAFAAGLTLLAGGLTWLLPSAAGSALSSAIAAALGVAAETAAGMEMAAGEGAVMNLSAAGVALALLSGVVTSGLGYALWYSALPRLRTTTAALSQLSVPILAAGGGVLLLGESLSLMLLVATVLVVAGIGVSLRR